MYILITCLRDILAMFENIQGHLRRINKKCIKFLKYKYHLVFLYNRVTFKACFIADCVIKNKTKVNEKKTTKESSIIRKNVEIVITIFHLTLSSKEKKTFDFF